MIRLTGRQLRFGNVEDSTDELHAGKIKVLLEDVFGNLWVKYKDIQTFDKPWGRTGVLSAKLLHNHEERRVLQGVAGHFRVPLQ